MMNSERTRSGRGGDIGRSKSREEFERELPLEISAMGVLPRCRRDTLSSNAEDAEMIERGEDCSFVLGDGGSVDAGGRGGGSIVPL